MLLKQLLDEELVEEDTFLAWAGDFTRNEYSSDQVNDSIVVMMMMIVMVVMVAIMMII